MLSLGKNTESNIVHKLDLNFGTADCSSGYRVGSRAIRLKKLFVSTSVKEYFEKIIEIHESSTKLCGRCFTQASIRHIKANLAAEGK